MHWYMVLAFALGAVVGALVMYLLRHRFNDTQALRRRLGEIQSELDSYRTQVDEHFERTSDLFQEVTQKYRDLHDHLAQGATGLTRGTKRLTSVELPEKSLLPARGDDGEERVVDEEVRPGVDPVDVTDAETAAAVPDEKHVGEDAQVSEPDLVSEVTDKR